MLLRRITKHVKDQNWFAVGLDFLIVIVGVFIGLQVANWNETRQERFKEDHYLERLDEEMDVIRSRLIRGAEALEGSVRNIELLLDVRRRYDADPGAELPTNSVLSAAAYGAANGAVPAGSPTAFQEMVASGSLEVLTNEKLRQALFAYDEYAAINRSAWRTLRSGQSDAQNRITGLVDVVVPEDLSDLPVAQETVSPQGAFETQEFLEATNVPKDLRVLFTSQGNQLALFQRQLALAESIETIIAESRE